MFVKKYSKGDTFIDREAALIGRDMDTFGAPKRPYEFRGIVPLKLEPEEMIVEAQILKDYRVGSEVLEKLLLPKAYLISLTSKGLLMTEQIAD